MASNRRQKYIEYGDEDDEDYSYLDEPGIESNDTHTEEDREQLRKGKEAVREQLGSELNPTDTEIEDALWHYYYDVAKSVAYIKNKYAPKQQKKAKPPSKFDQAAQEASAKAKDLVNVCVKMLFDVTHPWKALAEPLEAFDSEIQDRYCIDETQIPFKASEFFRDTPWLNVPAHRLGTITCEPRHPRLGLLGGSSTQSSGKPSKLAQLAAARKKAAEEKQKSKFEDDAAAATAKPRPNAMGVVPDKVGVHQKLSKIVASESSESGLPTRQKSESRSRTATLAQTAPSVTSLENKSSVSSVHLHDSIQEVQKLKAAPSTFARTVLGKQNASKDAPQPRETQLFALPFASDRSESNFEAFTGPSPDAIVLEAQSKGAKKNKSNGVKAESKEPTSDITDGVSDMKVEDSAPRVKRKSLDVVAEYKKSNAKNAASFVVIGHVDHGKSTLMGRLLQDLQVVNQRSMDKLRKEATAIGKSSFALAWVMDSTAEERQRGVTVDIATNYFETAKTRFTILDAPGHQDFIPNMIAGASQADFAVLVIDAGTNAFESGLRGQTKEHVLLARSLGIGRIIVAVNKMDIVSWSEDRFTTIKEQMSAFFTKQGFLAKNVSFVPCSGLTGENVVKPPVEGTMPWYSGGTLVDELDRSEPAKRAIADPLRLTISDIFRGGVQNPLSIAGRVDAGSLQVGDTLLAMPANEKATVRGIEVENEPKDWAVAGQIATLHLSDIDPVHLRLGDIICNPNNKPVKNTNSFTAKILAFDHVAPMFLDVYRGRLQAPARVANLIAVLDKQSGEIIKKKPRIVKPGDVARVRVDLEGATLPLEASARVVFRTGGTTVAAGLIESVQ